MAPVICPICQKAFTMGIWDNKTEKVYCSQCVPPLQRSTQPQEKTKEGNSNRKPS